jgi:hypothetical protein
VGVEHDGEFKQLRANSGLKAFPQPGDRFSYAVYLSQTDDRANIAIGIQGNIFNGVRIKVDARNNILQLDDSLTNASFADIASHLNEWLSVVVEWGLDGTVAATLLDSTGTELGTVSDGSFQKSGGIGLLIDNASGTSSSIYFDSFTLERRETEARTNTLKGTTQLGNEVVPSGSIQTGPTTSSTNAERAIYQDAPVDTTATQGTQSKLTLLQSGLHPAMFMERTLDGQGGAYGHQLDAALGRFARLNANLSWEYDSLADVPNWNSSDGGVSNWTFNVNSRPRRIHVEHDGSGSSNDNGGVIGSALTAYSSIGGFKITYHNVSWTENDSTNRIALGVHISPIDSGLLGNSGVYYQVRGDTDVLQSDSSKTTLSSQVDWSNNHDITILWDGEKAELYVDGVFRVSNPATTNDDFKPIIQLVDDSVNSQPETIECEQVTVEPLPEVLQ